MMKFSKRPLAVGLGAGIAGILALGSLGSLAQSGGNVAIALLKDANGKSVGSAVFVETSRGTQVNVRLQGLSAGKHGTHVHSVGSCADSQDASGNTVKFGGAGGHFDPASTAKHGTPEASEKESHAGDLPNTTVGADGTGFARSTFAKFTVAQGANSVAGKSVVIHAAEDDYKTNPAGNSGARVACGIVKAF
jgi:Cu-Zn family superoxide dismutase